MQESALRFAIDYGMAGLAYRAGELLRKDSGKTWLGAIYPIPRYDVEFSVDQALVWAISRQESGFNPRQEPRARCRPDADHAVHCLIRDQEPFPARP